MQVKSCHPAYLPLCILIGLSVNNNLYAEETKSCLDNQVWNPKLKVCEATSQLAEIVVLANRTATNSNLYAGQVAQIDSSRLMNHSRIMDNLSMVPGIRQGREAGRQIGQSYSIRGFGYGSSERVIIAQDDIPRDPSLYSNHISSFRTDIDTLKQVETVKGASSVLHGSGAIGGIINMQTKDATDYLRSDQEIGLSIGGRYESNNMHSGMMQIYGKPKHIPIDFLAHFKRALYGNVKLADGGFRDEENTLTTHTKNDERINTALFKFGWDMTQNQRLELSAFDFQEKLNTTWQTLFFAEQSSERPTPVKGKLKQKDYSLTYRFTPENPWIDFTLKSYYSRASYHRIFSSEKNYSNLFNDDKRHGVLLKNISIFNTGSLNHELVTGLDYKYTWLGFKFITQAGVQDNIAFPSTSRDTGLYFQDNIRISRFLFTLGGRYDHFQRQVKRNNTKKYTESRFSPRVALAFEVVDGLNLLAGYSETFRAPTAAETSTMGQLNPHYYYLPNTDLKPEVAKEYEVGFSFDKSRLFDSDQHINIKATYFNGKIKDMIALTALPELGKPKPPATAPSYAKYNNLASVKRRGYEIELKYLINNWILGASYDHLKLYNSQTGRKVSTFADKVTGSLTYFHRPWDLSVGVELNHWRKPKNDSLTAKRGNITYHYVNSSFTQMALRALWEPKKTGIAFFDQNMTVAFGVNNMFNRKYIAAGNILEVSPTGAARNFYLQVEKRF